MIYNVFYVANEVGSSLSNSWDDPFAILFHEKKGRSWLK